MTATLYGPDVAITLLFIGLSVAGIWGFLDAVVRPGWAFRAAGSSKTLWIVLPILLGGIPALIYLAAVRPRVKAAEATGTAYRSSFTSSPPGWFPDPSGRHQFRYWDGRQWTAGVSDNGVAGSDPPDAH